MAAICGPAAPAVVAGRKSIVGYGLRTARSRLLERDAQRDAHVTSTRPRRPACGARRSPTKERLKDVADAKAASEDVRHVNVVRPKAARAIRRAKAVVVRALALVREDRVGLVDLLELTLGVRRLVDVRVERPRLLEKRALDRLCVGVMPNAEDLVVVRTCCQSHHSPESSVCCRTNAPRDSPSGNERPRRPTRTAFLAHVAPRAERRARLHHHHDDSHDQRIGKAVHNGGKAPPPPGHRMDDAVPERVDESTDHD